MNLLRDIGRVIHDVSGSGSERASRTVRKPSGSGSVRVVRLRVIHSSAPRASHARAI